MSSVQNERAEENAQRRGEENTRARKSFVARAQTPPTTQNSSVVGEMQQKPLYFKNYISPRLIYLFLFFYLIIKATNNQNS